jgi:UDP-N-acetylglucosamine 2-epimerase (non-hydrolysing)
MKYLKAGPLEYPLLLKIWTARVVQVGRTRLQILHVVGARPNFMKAAPVYDALTGLCDCQQTLVHTGQHYDFNLSDVFFQQLGLPMPDYNLAVGSGSHARQTADIMTRFEDVTVECKPDVVVVYGDVNSTLATALVCAKLQTPVAHVEAGLRSFDRTMPEEINRLLTDQIADVLYTPSADGNRNLEREGIAREKIELVGNVMIDTLVRLLPRATEAVHGKLPANFGLITLHRPGNVDDPKSLSTLIEALLDIAEQSPLIFPVHPRTRARMKELGIPESHLEKLGIREPAPYLEFLGMQQRAAFVVTDSGGVQEETTYLNVPCLTLRPNTERPVTITHGTNMLIDNVEHLRDMVCTILAGGWKTARRPALWDGHASDRIAGSLRARYGAGKSHATAAHV